MNIFSKLFLSVVRTLFFIYSTSKESCEITLSKALKVLDAKYLNLEDVTFKSALRPLSGDDLPIVGKNMLLKHVEEWVQGMKIYVTKRLFLGVKCR